MMLCELNKVIKVEGLSELSWKTPLPMICSCAPKHRPLGNKTSVRSVAEQVLPQNKWKHSDNPAEKYASQAVLDLEFNDKHEAKLFRFLSLHPDFKFLRQQDRPLSKIEQNGIKNLIRAIRGGLVAKEPKAKEVKSLLIPIGQLFVQISDHKSVALSLFITRLQEHIETHNIRSLELLTKCTTKYLTTTLKRALPKGSYWERRSCKDAEELIKHFLVHDLPNMVR